MIEKTNFRNHLKQPSFGAKLLTDNRTIDMQTEKQKIGKKWLKTVKKW